MLALPQLLADSNDDRYLYGQALRSRARIGIESNDVWSYPLSDALGSVRQRTDSAGNVTGVASYDPFGGILQSQGAAGSFGFTGEWAGVTGLQYLRARWYDPGSGRFTQVDPFAGFVALPGTQHPYAYGLNNPLTYTDPSGEIVALLVATAVYAGGYLLYNYADDHVKEGIGRKALDVLGFVTGWKSIKKDIHTLSSTCSSKECKAVAAVDMAFNGALGISMFMGVGAMFKSAKAAWAMRGMASAERLAYLRGLAGPGITVNQGSRFFRPLGESAIELSKGALDDAGRLAGGFYHELAHVGQEFGTPKILRWAPQGLQRLSAWTTRTFKYIGPYLPTYLMNPVEIHAAVSGLGGTNLLRPMSWANLALPILGKFELKGLNAIFNKYLKCTQQ